MISTFGAPQTRKALFLALLSDEGLPLLREFLTSRKYKIELPEDAALLVATWLYENNRIEDAASIVAEISQYASELRFMPKSATELPRTSELVHRYSANDIRKRLKTYSRNTRIETQREALQIWIPFMDRLVFHWLELLDVATSNLDELPSTPESWKNTASELVIEYENLKKNYTQPTISLHLCLRT